jgi:hypothetical protein
MLLRDYFDFLSNIKVTPFKYLLTYLILVNNVTKQYFVGFVLNITCPNLEVCVYCFHCYFVLKNSQRGIIPIYLKRLSILVTKLTVSIITARGG